MIGYKLPITLLPTDRLHSEHANEDCIDDSQQIIAVNHLLLVVSYNKRTTTKK